MNGIFELLQRMVPRHRRLRLECSPVDVYHCLYRSEPWGFLYESLESPEKRGRFSFVGGRPFLRFESRGGSIETIGDSRMVRSAGPSMDVLRELVRTGAAQPDVRPFSGGAVGTVSYDAVRLFETLPDRHGPSRAPDLQFLFPSELVVFDHLEGTVDAILFGESRTESGINRMVDRLASCPAVSRGSVQTVHALPLEPRSNFTREEFCRAVEKAKAYIRAGDIFQVVVSQRFSFVLPADPWDVYRVFRKINPSPYMYYLHLDGRHVLGSSPEILVKVDGRRASIRPLAGTRPRGTIPEEDLRLESELLRDEKERAEHVMLVDLARNDLGRVCRYGSVRTTDLFGVERYSKVMHLVSNVEGVLEDGKDAFDAFASCFPAGTVSGAPKVRAMEIIDELEPSRRGPYAGAIGYFGFSGDMDMCIAIRMLTQENGMGTVQAGAGIVADSDPESEYRETLQKARAVLSAAGRMD